MTELDPLVGKRVLVGIGGGVAAYKVCEVVSTLVKSGIEVRTLLTDAAQQFVTPLTLTTLSRHPAYTDADFWAAIHARPLHIQLGEWADVLLIAPLTANTLGKVALGLADNLLTNTVLASNCPVLLAPAMNTAMWQQPTVQRRWQDIQDLERYHWIGPETGLLACDTVGTGRMAEPSDMVSYVFSLLYGQGKRDLTGKQLLISSGGTREYIDPVRFLSNPSTGKMGMALALAAWHRGATVRLVQATDQLVPWGSAIEVISVTSAAQMQAALLAAFPTADWTIMAAAVGDVKPAQYSTTKLPKQDLPTALSLETVPDIAQALGGMKRDRQQLIGFAAQTGNIIAPALEKLKRKGLDGIVANPVDLPNSGFGSDRNQAVFIDRSGQQTPILPCSKLMMAHQILDLTLNLEQLL